MIPFNPIVTGGRFYQAWELNEGSILAAGVDHYYRSIDNGLTWSIDSSYFSANVRPYNGEHFINNNNELYIDTYYDKILAERNGKTNLIKVNVNRPDIGQIYQKINLKFLQLLQENFNTQMMMEEAGEQFMII